MQGKVLYFKGNIDNFKTKDDEVTIQIKADTKDVSLDRLHDIAQGTIGIQLEAAQTELIKQDEQN
ncbi:hypothetical protein [Lactobacillus sp. ESL0677]|uniref:hypothetical protein n=1 Tax=Lactobacillus sp. ESL0677 TaxID=2983208 RepID=UPI0023F9335E|nr:hypothetical protein [Lactobacillus sp. ESL0677]WEV36238.1 hypothetical protein OZX76_05685 [Lactobacillus sp. ESL0677]